MSRHSGPARLRALIVLTALLVSLLAGIAPAQAAPGNATAADRVAVNRPVDVTPHGWNWLRDVTPHGWNWLRTAPGQSNGDGGGDTVVAPLGWNWLR